MVAARSQAKAIWPDFLVVMCVAQADAEDRNHSGGAVDLIADLQVALGELPINVVAWISVPNEPGDFYKKLTTCSELRIAPLQK